MKVSNTSYNPQLNVFFIKTERSSLNLLPKLFKESASLKLDRTHICTRRTR